MTKSTTKLDNNPLLTSESKLALARCWNQLSGCNLFFGLGIVTNQHLSQALPFDVLGIIFTAEQLRRALHSSTVFLFLADQHAITNHQFSTNTISRTTIKMHKQLQHILQSFGLSRFQIIQTTSLNSVASIRRIFASLPPLENQYLKHELADALWLHRFHQVRLKLGWSMNCTSQINGFDEKFFDYTIHQHIPQMKFVYTKPGRTLNPSRPRVSPYISIPGESRLLLTPNQNVTQKLTTWKNTTPPEIFKAAKRHLSSIVRLHDSLFPSREFQPLNAKLQTLVNKCA